MLNGCCFDHYGQEEAVNKGDVNFREGGEVLSGYPFGAMPSKQYEKTKRKEIVMKKSALFRITALFMCLSMLSSCGKKTEPAVSKSGQDVSTGTVSKVDFPTKEISIVCPFKAGGGVDVNARLVAKHLQEKYGWTVVVENITGGNTLPAAVEVLNRKHDGYTMFVNTNLSFLLAPQAYGGSFNPLEDFTPIISNTTTPVYLSVKADNDMGIKTAQDFIDWCKLNPGKATIACGGIADVTGVAAYNACKAMGLEVELVPYSGSAEALVALAGGHVLFSSSPGAATASYAKEGTIIPLIDFANLEDNVCGAPTIGSLGFGDASIAQYRVCVVPSDTPQEIVEILRDALLELCSDPDYIADNEAANDPVVNVLDGEQLYEKMVADYDVCTALIDELGLRNAA